MSADRVTKAREELRCKVLRLLEKHTQVSQREIVEALGVNRRAVNFCLKALLEKGRLKLANFLAWKNKFGDVYMLTPNGIANRAGVASRFLGRKLAGYKAIKVELVDLDYELSNGERVELAAPEG